MIIDQTNSDEDAAADAAAYVEEDPTGRYFRYDAVLGKGAFKTVYKGFDKTERIDVAWCKVKPADDAELLRRVLAEINLLESLHHDNVIRIFAWWVSDDDGKGKKRRKKKRTVNIVTELFSAGSLKQYRKKKGEVGIGEVKKWSREILKGLRYLHSHEPPIVHRDLKCDNVFIDDVDGEVKIGDFGFALEMQGEVEHEVVGTPEFMAPEMYEEEYNELVDVYSFGLCVLEMATCECPYKECTNAAQIYKKVISGVMPAALSRVEDAEVKGFIEKCLVSASRRLSAKELLDDPFLAGDDLKEAGSFHMEMDTGSERVSSVSSSGSWNLECRGFTKNNDALTLRGKMNSDGSEGVVLDLTVAGSGGKKAVEFYFYPDKDTAVSIAVDMVNQDLGLSSDDVSVAELIDRLVMEIVPKERPTSSLGAYSSCITTSGSGSENSAVSSMETWKSFSSSSSMCSLQSELSVVEKHDFGHLKAEIDSIDAQLQQAFTEMMKKKEEAIQIVKMEVSGLSSILHL